MPFNWREYLNLAQSLQGHSGGGFLQEAAFRCAVSRAYYAAFCHARNFARDKQSFVPFYDARDHRELKEHFKKTRRIDIVLKLDQLRVWRNNCDFDDDVSNISLMVNDAIKHSSDIFTKIY